MQVYSVWRGWHPWFPVFQMKGAHKCLDYTLMDYSYLDYRRLDYKDALDHPLNYYVVGTIAVWQSGRKCVSVAAALRAEQGS